jgi:hypothetical protein
LFGRVFINSSGELRDDVDDSARHFELQLILPYGFGVVNSRL